MGNNLLKLYLTYSISKVCLVWLGTGLREGKFTYGIFTFGLGLAIASCAGIVAMIAMRWMIDIPALLKASAVLCGVGCLVSLVYAISIVGNVWDVADDSWNVVGESYPLLVSVCFLALAAIFVAEQRGP